MVSYSAFAVATALAATIAAATSSVEFPSTFADAAHRRAFGRMLQREQPKKTHHAGEVGSQLTIGALKKMAAAARSDAQHVQLLKDVATFEATSGLDVSDMTVFDLLHGADDTDVLTGTVDKSGHIVLEKKAKAPATITAAKAIKVERSSSLSAFTPFSKTTAAAAAAGAAAAGSYNVTYMQGLQFKSFDGTILEADGFHPNPKLSNPRETFPVVLFPNSWGQRQVEYFWRCYMLSMRGYVAVEYQVRGWYNSGGTIQTAGHVDRQDGSALIDFVFAHAAEWHVKTTPDAAPVKGPTSNVRQGTVAFAGISLGAGISILMAGHDPRVATSVVMSGWNSLLDFAYGFETPNTHMARGLYHSATEHGRPDPDLKTFLTEMTNHVDMDAFYAYAQERSAEHLYFDSVFANATAPHPALFLSNNYLDRLFRPQFMEGMVKRFYNKNANGKMSNDDFIFLMNGGMHAESGAAGLFVAQNYVWNRAFEWLDSYLKGIVTPVLSEPKVQYQYGGFIGDGYLGFDDYWGTSTSTSFSAKSMIKSSTSSTPEAPVTPVSFHLTPRTNATSPWVSYIPIGGLSLKSGRANANTDVQRPQSFSSKSVSSKAASVTQTADAALNTIGYSSKQPVLNSANGKDVVRSLGIPHVVELDKTEQASSIVFASETLAHNITICGSPKVNLKVKPTAGSTAAARGWQVYGYLYEVYPDSAALVGNLLSHGFYTKWYDSNQTSPKTSTSSNNAAVDVDGVYTTAGWEFHNFCRTIPAGYRVAVGFTLYDEMFTAPNTNPKQGLEFVFDASTTLTFPTV